MKFGKIHSLLFASALAASAASLTSCKKPMAEAPPETAPQPAAMPAAAPNPAPAATIAAATPAPDPLAPPGVFFLLQKTSITTDDGITGFKPGQLLQQVGPGTYTADGQTLQLRDDQVTNNLRIARQFAAADASAHAALRQALQPKPAARMAASATPAPATPAPTPARPAAPTNHLGSGGTMLGTNKSLADPEVANRKNARVDGTGRQYWRDSKGNIRYDF